MHSRQSVRSAGLLVLAVFLTLAVPQADAQLYKWTDEFGRTIISDTPPPGQTKHQQIRKAVDPAEKTAAVDANKPKLANGDGKPAEDGGKNESAACSQARQNLQALESGRPLTVTNERGERVPMDNATRALELARVRETLSTCPQF